MCSAGVKYQRLIQKDSEGGEQHIGEKVVEFDHNDGGDGEPDRRKNRSCGEELFHGFGSRGCGGMSESIAAEASNQIGVFSGVNQRGDTVILLSAWVSLPLVNSPKAARGQLAAARVLLKANGTSIWISCMVASLRVATAWR